MNIRSSLVEHIAGNIAGRSSELHEAIADAMGVGTEDAEITAPGQIDEEDYSALTWITCGLIGTTLTYFLLTNIVPGLNLGFLILGKVLGSIGIFTGMIVVAMTGLSLALIGILLANRTPFLGYLCVWLSFVSAGVMLHLQLAFIGTYAEALFTIIFLAPAVFGVGLAFKDNSLRHVTTTIAVITVLFFSYKYGLDIYNKWQSMPTAIGQVMAVIAAILITAFGTLTGRILAVCARCASPTLSPFTAAAYALGVIAIVYWTQLVLMIMRAQRRG